MRLDYPATGRNRDAILAVLSEVLGEEARVLEVASGSGQHSAFFTRQQPRWSWQPTDIDPAGLASIAAWRDAGGPLLREPIALDVTAPVWPIEPIDAIFCANMIHIAPWPATLGLVAGATRHLPPGAPLVLYGPFRMGGQHTSASNARFDASLKARDPRWGVRDLEDVSELATGFTLERSVPMPANNQTVIWRRR